ncbi:nicotinate mononucleotide-dependent phosphoribosyltransferase CobT [Stetteria hydrogenophila]
MAAQALGVDLDRVLFTLFIGSTRTSTIPGISIAGPTPEATLYTPTLDAEYLIAGRPVSMDAVPVSPEGVPTPAIVSRAILRLLGIPALVVDSGAFLAPRIPHVALPSRRVGERIDRGRALPPGTAERLYSEARLLGRSLGGRLDFVVGESMPGGTTTAMAVMEALGFRARGRVSSAGPVNPHGLKARVYEEALKATGLEVPARDPFEAVDAVGDPLHVSIAGFTAGAVEAGSRVVLGGGTQMCAILAILRRLGVSVEGRVTLATTRWLAGDGSSDVRGLLSEVYPGVPLLVSSVDFSRSRFRGLRMYEEGYVKEGVGMGGLLALASQAGIPGEAVLEAVEEEYARVSGLAGEAGEAH